MSRPARTAEHLSFQVIHRIQQAWVQSRIQRVARRLPRAVLRASSAPPPELDPLALVEGEAQPRFLDYYGDQGIETAFEHYGIFDDLRQAGFDDVEVALDIQEGRHAASLSGRRAPDAERELLTQLLMRRDVLVPSDDLAGLARSYEVLVIDWLMLQNPRKAFTRRRSRLPGQAHPGLGIGIQVAEIFAQMAERLNVDGVLTTAEYFHNAFMYEPRFPFLSPCEYGTFRALRRTLMRDQGLTLSQASWAVRRGFVIDDATGEPFVWQGAAQILPRSQSLRDFLSSEWHDHRSLEVADLTKLRLDSESFESFWDSTFAKNPGWLPDDVNNLD